jgi:nanoRNase/pAp phosphatase (c-di-AMP/oligoRNAs hydrolase)
MDPNTTTQQPATGTATAGSVPVNPNLPPTWQQSVQMASQLLSYAKDVGVVIPSYPDVDMVSAASAVAVSLKKIGKNVTIVSPTPVDPAKVFSGLKREEVPQILVDTARQIATNFDQKQLVLTVDYIEGSFSKGNIEKADDGLMLKLVKGENGKPINPINIDTKVISCMPSVFITIAVDNLANLDSLYRDNEAKFKSTPVINITTRKDATFGKVNLTDPKATSFSEMATLFLYDLRFMLDKERAEMLKLGMEKKTNGLDKQFHTANLLEATSICLRYIQAPTPKM